ncbi:hypothetical protein [Clostridium sp. VAP52]|uniref:hypothetical protein n=1 Tax=Clostridium sp. VAP52 TaxID=2949977 RepID=UPI00207A7B13|nr:hypothetical protein [Clostridium sp. VAP52]
MSVDIWDMAERATKIVKEQIKNDIYEDEVTAIFYQEFCEPTLIEKEYEIKYKWMIKNGFKKEKDNGIDVLVYNDDFYWSKEDIEYNSLSEIKEYIEFYKEEYE